MYEHSCLVSTNTGLEIAGRMVKTLVLFFKTFNKIHYSTTKTDLGIEVVELCTPAAEPEL